MRGLVQFVTSLPGAMLLTGFLMERLGVLWFLEGLALEFQRVSADIWAAIFAVIPIRIPYDPNILSTYTLLVVPLAFEIVRNQPIKEFEAKDWYAYGAGLLAVALIVTGYDAWGFIVDIYRAIGLILLTLATIFVLYLPFNLIWLTFFGFMGMVRVNGVLTNVIFLILIASWIAGYDLADALLNTGLPPWIKEPVADMIGLYSWSTLWAFLFGIFTLVVLLAAPLTKAPLFVVAWVGAFFAADWFDTNVAPVLNDYLEGLRAAHIYQQTGPVSAAA